MPLYTFGGSGREPQSYELLKDAVRSVGDCCVFVDSAVDEGFEKHRRRYYNYIQGVVGSPLIIIDPHSNANNNRVIVENSDSIVVPGGNTKHVRALLEMGDLGAAIMEQIHDKPVVGASAGATWPFGAMSSDHEHVPGADTWDWQLFEGLGYSPLAHISVCPHADAIGNEAEQGHSQVRAEHFRTRLLPKTAETILYGITIPNRIALCWNFRSQELMPHIVDTEDPSDMPVMVIDKRSGAKTEVNDAMSISELFPPLDRETIDDDKLCRLLLPRVHFCSNLRPQQPDEQLIGNENINHEGYSEKALRSTRRNLQWDFFQCCTAVSCETNSEIQKLVELHEHLQCSQVRMPHDSMNVIIQGLTAILSEWHKRGYNTKDIELVPEKTSF